MRQQLKLLLSLFPYCIKSLKFIGLALFVVTLTMVAREYLDLQSTETRWRTLLKMPRISRQLNVSSKAELQDYQGNEELKCLDKTFQEVLLVVAFGAMSEFESMPLFEVMFKKIFKNRLYCGPDYLNGQTSFEGSLFLKENTRFGAFLYDCLSRVIEKHQNYTGYIFVGEGTILNPKLLRQLDLDKVWESNRTISGPDLYGQVSDTMEWWMSPWGIQALQKLYEYLTEMDYFNNRKVKMTEGHWMPDWDVGQALNRWLWNGHGIYRTYWSPGTFLYLPKHYANIYLNITKHGRSSGVRHEIALPTFMKLIELDRQTIKIPTGLINQDNENDILGNREQFKKMLLAHGMVFLEGKRKDRRQMLNHLTLKEHGIGEFLHYNNC